MCSNNNGQLEPVEKVISVVSGTPVSPWMGSAMRQSVHTTRLTSSYTSSPSSLTSLALKRSSLKNLPVALL